MLANLPGSQHSVSGNSQGAAAMRRILLVLRDEAHSCFCAPPLSHSPKLLSGPSNSVFKGQVSLSLVRQVRSLSGFQLEHLLPAGLRGDPDMGPSPPGSDDGFITCHHVKQRVMFTHHCALTGNMGTAPLPFSV